MTPVVILSEAKGSLSPHGRWTCLEGQRSFRRSAPQDDPGRHPERSERIALAPRPLNCLEGQRSFRRCAPQDDPGRHPERSERIALAPRPL